MTNFARGLSTVALVFFSMWNRKVLRGMKSSKLQLPKLWTHKIVTKKFGMTNLDSISNCLGIQAIQPILL